MPRRTAKLVDGTLTYDSLADGSRLVYVDTPIGPEELRVFPRPVEHIDLTWELRLQRDLVDVRVRDGRVELARADGFVALQTAPIVAYTANGAVLPLSLELKRDGEAFLVRASLDVEPLNFPLVVDPLWTSVAPMSVPREAPTLTVLASGKVLATGGRASGVSVSSAEIYDPSTNTWTSTGNMLVNRVGHSATLLESGKVLIAGGRGGPPLTGGKDASQSTSELFDPSSNTFAAGPDLTQARHNHSAFRVPGAPKKGWVVVSGGEFVKGSIGGGALTSAEIYDPSANAFSTAATFPDGKGRRNVGDASKLVILGGAEQATDANLFFANDFTTPQWVSTTPKLSIPRAANSTSVAGALMVAAGGADSTGVILSSAEIFSITATTTKSLGLTTMSAARSGHIVRTLTSGKHVVLGGYGAGGSFVDALDVYDPISNSWAPAAPLPVKRTNFSAVSLGTKVLIAGGLTASGASNLVDVFEPLPNGTACAGGGDCSSGFCVDGVCCDTACNDACHACSKSAKGAGLDGSCGVVAADTDPHADCAADPGYPKSCKADGLCDGAGKCRVYAKPTVSCGTTATACAGGMVSGQLCNGAGSCTTSAPVPCSPYICDGAGVACTTSCKTDAECAADAICVDAKCTNKRANGVACSLARECSSGFCVDGVCCNNACPGQCQTCAAAGSTGSCTTVAGSPVPGRAPCAGTGTACGGVCDGSNAITCSYPSIATDCGSSCSDGLVDSKQCDGKGACVSKSQSCGGYGCDGPNCRTICSSNSDCSSGFVCAAGKCVPQAKGTCSGDLASSTDVTGKVTPCDPYRCDESSGTCRSRCTNSDDCAAGLLCEATTSSCAQPPATDDGGGCAVAVAASSAPARKWDFAALVALMLARRMRRRR